MPGWSARTRRLIPAHAGKTSTVSARPPRTGAHPRSRGENNRAVGTARTSSGSSPLTRGKPCRTGNTRPCLGLIPAHAGKTTGEALPTESRAAHPRSRGENGQRFVRAIIGSGSSPLTRGKLAVDCRYRHRGGLIPAHAGKTFSEPLRRSRAWAHPRSRVENWRVSACSSLRAGSSPLTRGKHDLDVGHARRWGLIPAHAGKTCRRRSHSVPCHSPIAEVALVAVGRAHAARTNRFTPGTPSRNMSAQL